LGGVTQHMSYVKYEGLVRDDVVADFRVIFWKN
jgi:hypothetical protein